METRISILKRDTWTSEEDLSCMTMKLDYLDSLVPDGQQLTIIT